jgi:hypothetical protein
LVGAAGFELAVADEITDRHVAALDILGWKIVSQNDPARRWPFNGTMEGCTCPKWCDDINNTYPMLPESLGQGPGLVRCNSVVINELRPKFEGEHKDRFSR